MVDTQKFSFKGTGSKLVMTVLYAGLGAVATFLLTEVPTMDFGELTPFIGALAPVIANSIRQFIRES